MASITAGFIHASTDIAAVPAKLSAVVATTLRQLAVSPARSTAVSGSAWMAPGFPRVKLETYCPGGLAATSSTAAVPELSPTRQYARGESPKTVARYVEPASTFASTLDSVGASAASAAASPVSVAPPSAGGAASASAAESAPAIAASTSTAPGPSATASPLRSSPPSPSTTPTERESMPPMS